MNDILSRVKKIHFVGIGGSGMCPIAEILIHRGYEVSGSDNAESDTLQRMRSYGIPIFMGQCAENVQGRELVVYSAAIKADNPELVAAKELGIPCVERSVMLGMVTSRYPKSICVSGTHGKTTTTGLITSVLLDAGADPSAVIGGKLPRIGTNGRAGSSDKIVVEACEYVDTFLHLHPYLAVILNIDADHLDYFKNLDNIIRSFRQFATQTSGVLVVNGDDANTQKAVAGLEHAKIITFGQGKDCNYRAVNISDTKEARENFDVMKDGKILCNVTLSIPGKHNIYNALAAFAVCDYFGVPTEQLKKSLHAFTGVHRRFEMLGKYEGITIADDFAHHPTELTATLTAAMQMGFREVWTIFQPHTYSRTALLLDDFAKALTIPDHAVVSEILAVRETNTYNVYAEDLVKKVPGAVYRKTFEEIADYVMERAKSGDLILTMGGGNIYQCANLIVGRYKARAK
ncbi:MULTISPECIES: UDP-N-acetylmuramate--L-alanine ligase [Caproicibacterium]|uniref:UDP-N-acetylmuramate--L-alanine ligase n=1 Tax=Caproicibacterium argilliputei TaxID=3030016 RepID=A0AA97D7N1_9FIRM|nr:UDP-N-acetylmuramate--L-alanine ligase [Caproicibacterium argilliputei]WOC31179.1 UDP-N-acetylmuramate--L-alanine ligase [Caproicibacterium argilliputei]